MVENETLVYKLYYNLYRVSHKLKLWSLYWAIDGDTGIPFVESKWFWQNKDGLKGMGYEENYGSGS